ncbi:hypothetical protein [Simiduia agarivorans]|uniref:Uncharacterized protein n=1 Tax=Simiduia agarivorans (strain DSM 21679 / JCM 13881 / BCRC 17597 / SA1) TaxID=1117647 RepID=K4L1Q8_SIMAS|nr:hypothetical protein [Simiduia agarivorans]AFV00108.1 hypothetical protein M5M_14865 [Simiduia agarivorans SA1 = DSM 21679]
MFDIKLLASPSVKELLDIKRALKEAWYFLQYPYFEASNFQVSRKYLIFRFVTLIGENQFYVTGKVTVSGIVYEQLAKSA